MKKHILLCLFFCVLFLLPGCSVKTDQEGDSVYTVYYMDRMNCILQNQSYQTEETEKEVLVKELAEQINTLFLSIDLNEDVRYAVTIEDMSLNHSVLSIYLIEAYYNLQPVDELLFQASYVLTMTQIPGIDAVNFYVGDEPLKDRKGNNVDTLTAASFTNNIGEGTLSYTEETITSYFADETGTSLQPYREEIRLGNNMSMEQYIVNRLVKGPEGSGYMAVLDPGTKVLSVSTKENICYVNFDAKFLEGSIGTDPKISLYAVVNSLTELSFVKYVQISINGETTYTFGGVDLSVPLQRNSSYMK